MFNNHDGPSPLIGGGLLITPQIVKNVQSIVREFKRLDGVYNQRKID